MEKTDIQMFQSSGSSLNTANHNAMALFRQWMEENDQPRMIWPPIINQVYIKDPGVMGVWMVTITITIERRDYGSNI